MIQLLLVFRRNRGAIAHFFGMKRVGLLLGLLSLFRPGVRTIYTPVHFGGFSRHRLLARLERTLLRQLDLILPTSNYVADMLSRVGLASGVVLRPGVTKDLGLSDESHAQGGVNGRSCVLFWRDATLQNGVDIAAKVFRDLAPEHPHVDFIFAVRFEDESAKEMRSVAAEMENVKVHRHPYPAGVSLQGLLRRSACVLLPMRTLSVQPQFAVLESMVTGVPVVTTNIESNLELIESGVTGFLFDPCDVSAAARAVRLLISDDSVRIGVSEASRRSAQETYSYPRLLRELTSVYDDLGGRA